MSAARVYAALRGPDDVPWLVLPAATRLRADAAMREANLEFAADLREDYLAVVADRDRLADLLAQALAREVDAAVRGGRP